VSVLLESVADKVSLKYVLLMNCLLLGASGNALVVFTAIAT